MTHARASGLAQWHDHHARTLLINVFGGLLSIISLSNTQNLQEFQIECSEYYIFTIDHCHVSKCLYKCLVATFGRDCHGSWVHALFEIREAVERGAGASNGTVEVNWGVTVGIDLEPRVLGIAGWTLPEIDVLAFPLGTTSTLEKISVVEESSETATALLIADGTLGALSEE